MSQKSHPQSEYDKIYQENLKWNNAHRYFGHAKVYILMKSENKAPKYIQNICFNVGCSKNKKQNPFVRNPRFID